MCCQLFCFFFCCCCCFTPFFPVCLFMFLVSLLCRAVSAGAGGVLSLSLLHIGLAFIRLFAFVMLPCQRHTARVQCAIVSVCLNQIWTASKNKNNKSAVFYWCCCLISCTMCECLCECASLPWNQIIFRGTVSKTITNWSVCVCACIYNQHLWNTAFFNSLPRTSIDAFNFTMIRLVLFVFVSDFEWYVAIMWDCIGWGIDAIIFSITNIPWYGKFSQNIRRKMRINNIHFVRIADIPWQFAFDDVSLIKFNLILRWA